MHPDQKTLLTWISLHTTRSNPVYFYSLGRSCMTSKSDTSQGWCWATSANTSCSSTHPSHEMQWIPEWQMWDQWMQEQWIQGQQLQMQDTMLNQGGNQGGRNLLPITPPVHGGIEQYENHEIVWTSRAPQGTPVSCSTPTTSSVLMIPTKMWSRWKRHVS